MGFLSDRSTTASTTGGYAYIIIPNAEAATGYDSHRISITDLHSALNSLITTNANAITALTSRVVVTENVSARIQYLNQTFPVFNFTQPANSIITKIRLRSSGSATFSIAGSVTGAIENGTLTNGLLYDIDYIIDSVSGQSITFSITGTVSVEIYYNKSTI